MHASWNQWGGTVAPQVTPYGAAYPQAAPPATPFGSVNPFQAAPPATTPAVPSAYQNPLYAQTQPPPPQQPPQTPQQQQQWQQWEQWQQQYAQWHQQYGDKYQGPLPTGMVPPAMPAVPNPYLSIPPLPPGAPTAQPPPPDSVPPPSTDKNDTDPGKRTSQDTGKEETKKQKTGKGKAETVEDLIEQEKTFDEQFKTWESSFIKWKEQNANHPDKTQYKEYEAKWESWREQLIQKREQLRKKRENKEAEVAAAAAAAKEAALATSSNAPGYSTASTAAVTQSAPYMPSSMMYPMAGMYPTQDMSQMASQSQNFMPNYPMYNMPPPNAMPPMSMMPPMPGHDQQNKQKMDPSKPNQSLEFLTSSASNAKSIPGLDLVGSDKPPSTAATAATTAVPPGSSIPSSKLFAYNQDVTKPLHTSDDKPFNFPTPPQPNNFNYNEQSRNQYSSFQLSRPPPSLPPNQFQKNYPYDQTYDQKNDSNDFPPDRNRFDDNFGNHPGPPGPNTKFDDHQGPPGPPGPNSKFDNYRPPPVDMRNNPPPDNKNSKFGGTTYTPNFNSEKYAKYYEDEYDDSRFRDPEPSESPQRNNNSQYNNYGRNDRDNFSNFRQNNFGNNRGGFNNKFDDFNRDFNEPPGNRKEMGRGRGRSSGRPPFGDANQPDGPNSFNNRYRGFGRGQSSDNAPRPNFNSWQSNDPLAPPDRFDNADNDKPDFGKPVSLLDLPMMKPPDSFDKKPFDDKPGAPFGNDKPLDSNFPKNDSFKVGDMDNSRLGFNVPPPFKGNFGDADNSRPGPRDPNSQFDGPGGRQGPGPDMNKFQPPESFPPPKPQRNASNLRNKDDAAVDKPAPAEAAPQDLVPSLVFDYEHVKKTSAETLPSTFDAVYIFDYAHGKKKAVDNKDFIESLASEVKANDRNSWQGEPWQNNKKPAEVAEPLPQRNKPSDDLTKELAAILNKSETKSEPLTENKPKEVNKDDVVEKKTFSAPWLRDTVKEAPAKVDEPMEQEPPTEVVQPPLATVEQPPSATVEQPPPAIEKQPPPVAMETSTPIVQPPPAPAATSVAKPTVTEKTLLPANSKLIDDLLLPPGRHSRPIKLIIVMRGPPGSGKTYTAKLIKDKEIEMGGTAPRILSLDDYFTNEEDVESTDPITGKKITKRETVYEYEAEMEPSYQESLVKSFKKQVSDGFFPFIIIDCINDKVKKYEEMYSFALSKGFQVFVCEMDMDVSTCSKRNVHKRTEEEIQKLVDGWEKTPPSQTTLDIRSLLQSAAITEVDMVDVEEEVSEKDKPTKETEKDEEPDDENAEPAAESDEQDEPTEEEPEKAGKESLYESTCIVDTQGFSSYMDSLCTSKWEKSENTEEKLDRLDGVSKKKGSTTFKEWLQLPEDETDLSWYASNDKASNDKTAATAAESNVPRKKRVRWADLEERVAQQKMRAIGFVVGQTDWKRMMDPSFGGSKLTQTKYIYK
ncbi:YLP motif-containing protein 1 isoform X2 [Planococcus citri]|uniref:YLP motif-containing protein 1 isoform X2 n=1 Tax=Planococcus citri TaxID=170843 RepID=UPI0031F82A01